jgi:glucose/arabinose dehydrogenase
VVVSPNAGHYRGMARRLLACGLLLLTAAAAWGTPPEGFTRTVMSGDYEEIIGITPIGDGRFLAWERGGLVWILSADGEASEAPFLDLSEEVMAWRDHGFMGLTIDPDFLDNGLVYALYVVDPHHLYMYGSSAYDPSETWTNMATIGRLTRYQATAASDFSIVDPSTRSVLVGETIDTGIPILHQSHGLGSLFFGTDGSLLFSMGDSASYLTVDTGGQTGGGWINEALNVGIMTEDEDVGAFRSQLLNSLCGKINRVDPETGDGLASNPYFDAKDPRAAKSRVWALGLLQRG